MSKGPQHFPQSRHFHLTTFGCLAAFAISASAFAQASANNLPQVPPSRLTFASATVTPSGAPDFRKIEADVKAGKLPAPRAPAALPQVQFYSRYLRELIMLAYNVKIYQISGPSWLPDQRFDVIATMPDGASPSDTPAMLQALLEDRFKLVAHRQIKNRATLSLKVAKGSPKLLPAAGTGSPIRASAPSGQLEITSPTPAGPMTISNNGHDGSTLTFPSTTMDGLAEVLTYLLHGGYDNLLAVQNVTEDEDQWQVVVNQTGLTGEYQAAVNSSLVTTTIETRIAEDISGSSPVTTHDFLGPAKGIDEWDAMVFASLQKLGLNLGQSSAKLDMLVISHAEKNPTPN